MQFFIDRHNTIMKSSMVCKRHKERSSTAILMAFGHNFINSLNIDIRIGNILEKSYNKSVMIFKFKAM